MFEYGGLDLVLPQKLLLCLAFFGLLERCRDHRSEVLTLISATSFAIFFLHMIFLMVLKKIDLANSTEIAWVDVALSSTVVVALSIAGAVAANRILGAKSRMLVGY